MDNFTNEVNNTPETTVDYSQPGTFTGATAQWQANNVQEELPTFTESFGDAYSYEAPVFEETKKNNGKVGIAITAMILGILSVICCPTYLWFVDVIFAIVALIMGIVAFKKKYAGKGMAIAAIICGSIGLVFSGIMAIMWIVAIVSSAVGTASSSYYYY